MTTIAVGGIVAGPGASAISLSGITAAAASAGSVTLAGLTCGAPVQSIPDDGVWFSPDGTTWRPAELWLFVP